MDNRPNPNSPRVSVSESETVPPATIQGQPPMHGQSETQIPFVSSTEAHGTLPPSPDASNEPALWQLGRHSYYKSSTGYHQHSTSFSGQLVVDFTEGNGYGGGPRYPPHQVNSKVDEAGLRDVEEELHRGLQARQV